eukprot:m.405789 g.405789  ORF g.405789 m.405789 type:complete len:229 (+) comp21210_c0_seq8:69-755(+)
MMGGLRTRKSRREHTRNAVEGTIESKTVRTVKNSQNDTAADTMTDTDDAMQTCNSADHATDAAHCHGSTLPPRSKGLWEWMLDPSSSAAYLHAVLVVLAMSWLWTGPVSPSIVDDSVFRMRPDTPHWVVVTWQVKERVNATGAKAAILLGATAALTVALLWKCITVLFFTDAAVPPVPTKPSSGHPGEGADTDAVEEDEVRMHPCCRSVSKLCDTHDCAIVVCVCGHV